jgi:TPR repeat protein
MLGVCYFNGWGVDSDDSEWGADSYDMNFPKGFEFFLKAANKENNSAWLSLGWCY